MKKGGQQLVAALPSAPKVTGSTGDVASERDRGQARHLHREEGRERDRRRAGAAQPPVHPLRARRELLDQGRQGLDGASRAASPRGARAGALHVQVRDRHRLGVRLPAASARRSGVRDLRLPEAERRQGAAQPAARRLDRSEDARDRRDAEAGARARRTASRSRGSTPTSTSRRRTGAPC